MIDAGALAELSEGDHSAVFQRLTGDQLLSTGLTRVSPSGVKGHRLPQVFQSDLMGSNVMARRGPSVEVEMGLVVINSMTGSRGVAVDLRLKWTGRGRGLNKHDVAGRSRIVVDLTETGTRSLIAVDSTGRILVERRVPSADALRRRGPAGMPCC